MPLLHAGRFRLRLDRPLVMGIVNVTPDSFAQSGPRVEPGVALAHAERLLDEGADLLDIGAESSRPGAQPVEADEEWRRLQPVLAQAVRWNVPISVDTYRPATMRRALDLGCSLVNDIRGFQEPGAVEAVAGSDAALCVMHMQGRPATMQAAPRYDDVVAEVEGFLRGRCARLREAGVEPCRLLADPGFGFGKTAEHNLALLRALPRLADALGVPLLVGLSRKGLLGVLTGRPVEERLVASVAAALWAAAHGAAVLRVHDVRATRDALAVWRGFDGTARA
jgi:dihydropteroate synthase